MSSAFQSAAHSAVTGPVDIHISSKSSAFQSAAHSAVTGPVEIHYDFASDTTVFHF
jgi:hypothetical protein